MIVPDFDRKVVIVPSRVPSRILTGCPGLSRPVARFWACPVVPLSRDNEGTSVPLSRKVALSRPVGNTNWNPRILRPRALFYRTDCTRRSKFLMHALEVETSICRNIRSAKQCTCQNVPVMKHPCRNDFCRNLRFRNCGKPSIQQQPLPVERWKSGPRHGIQLSGRYRYHSYIT